MNSAKEGSCEEDHMHDYLDMDGMHIIMSCT